MGKNNLVINKEKNITTMERVFHASREQLWKAHTDRDLIVQWWGPKEYETIIETMDVKPGGTWRFIHKNEKESYTFYGEYKEIKEPEYITWTFNFEPIGPGHEVVETIHFEDVGEGKTKVSTVSHYKSIEDLDGMVQSGMEGGATESWDRLEVLAENMK